MENTDAALAYVDVVKRFLGEQQPHRFIEEDKRGFFARLFGGDPYVATVG
jgi:septum site-determining protein MinD